MIKDLIKELENLASFEQKYNSLLKDYNETVERLYQLELEKWENARPQDRQKYHKETQCSACRWFSDVKGERCRIPSDIMKPSLYEDKNGRKRIRYDICKRFEWD